MTAGNNEHTEDKPPFFSSWKGMYILVVANLAVMVIIFYLISRYLQ